LELVTGKPAILSEPEPTNIIHWVQQRLTQGNIEGVVDAQLHGAYNVNGVWKVAEIALKCTTQASVQRPTMGDVVAQLHECVELEESRTRDFNSGGSSNSAFGMELRMPTVATGPVVL
uniref:Serine-threonine/tyrosine-protein kinase catalytic domain-containing protein n=1 Tax=Aegilops tauschii subsp. strangulata TaxID=200361 RepID=A0A452XMR7_AEGTS